MLYICNYCNIIIYYIYVFSLLYREWKQMTKERKRYIKYMYIHLHV